MKTHRKELRSTGMALMASALMVMFTWLALGASVVSSGDLLPLSAQASSAAPASIPTPYPHSPASSKKSGSPPALDLQSQKEQRFRELKRQMEILKQRPSPTHAQPAQSGQVPESEQRDEVPHIEEPVPQESTPHPELEKSDSPQLVPAEEQASHEHTPQPPVIVEGTIDRFALATSLFGTGQAETCLDVLKHTDLTQLPREDQIWAEYMQACCQRKTGQIDLARQSFRRILAEKDADWIGQLASWWLHNLEEKTKLQTDVQRLSETLTAWETEIDTLSRHSTGATADH